MTRFAQRTLSVLIGCLLSTSSTVAVVQAAGWPPVLTQQTFDKTPHGRTPASWIDLAEQLPSRGWIVDGKGQLRFVHKLRTGLLAFNDRFLDGTKPASLTDATVSADFYKTEDAEVTFGLAGRIVDRDNYYLARFRGSDRLELLKVVKGREVHLDVRPPSEGFAPRVPGLATRDRYRPTELPWSLELLLVDDRIEATVRDDLEQVQAKLTARDSEFTRGRVGICCTPFASASAFEVHGGNSIPTNSPPPKPKSRVPSSGSEWADKPIVKPTTFSNKRTLITTPDETAAKYDVIVAGAGCSGWAAAVQASRLGAKVLLLEETDWIGGQMGAAAVTSMDEDGVRHTYAVRERGLYREFHESMTAYYHTLNKDPLVAYFSWPEQREGGYEPKVVRSVLYGFLQREKKTGAAIDVVLQARVAAVRKAGNKIVGARLTIGVEHPTERDVECGVLIDSTEYGDVIPLTGARYRVGNSLSDQIDSASLVQDHTWTAVLCEYPDGVPEALQIKEPPPGYADYAAKRWKNYKNEGAMLWGAAGKGIKGPRNWRVYFAWRGMADTESPLVGRMSAQRHTQCGFNGGNDYAVTAATIEDPQQRRIDEREGIYRTLGALYYFQHELGVPWSLAADEGYDTPYQRWKMKQLNLRPDLEKLAVHLPQQPYVRECRRIVGVKTLAAADLGRYENAKLFPTSVAMGDYFMDLDHGKTAHAIEADLDGAATAAGQIPHGGGPFQVPLETLIPETIDGFLTAEKNISQSRLVNGATRLQPIAMLTGQAAGAIAALAVKQDVQPRELNPVEVQTVLLDAGSTLVQRWYSDVPWRSPLWQATQLLSLHGVMDRPMQIDDDPQTPLGAEAKWGVDEPLRRNEMQQALLKLAGLHGLAPPKFEPNDTKTVTRTELRVALESVHESWSRLSWEGEAPAEPRDGKSKTARQEPRPPVESRSSATEIVTAGEFARVAAQALRQPLSPK